MKGTITIIAAVTILSITQVPNAFAHKLLATSYQDGYNRGQTDAHRDWNGLNGHGYDSSCPSGHTDVYCDGYGRGYNRAWGTMKEDSTATSYESASSQRSNLGQSSGDINVKGSGNTIEVHQSQAQSSSTRNGPTYVNQPQFNEGDQ